MSEAFLRDLGIGRPDVSLGVGTESPSRQVARVIERLTPELERLAPDCVVVVGDVNSTLGAALAAAKMSIPLAHVEAGLRSRDRTMPEELNRILTDACADFLFTTEPDAEQNLLREGVPASKIHFVGNVMIDSLRRFEARARSSRVLDELGLPAKGFALVTLHRPSNVDRPEDLSRVVSILEETAARLPVVFPVHPRTRARFDETGAASRLAGNPHVHLQPPVGYIDFIRLLSTARIVMTDSGGIQEETTVLGVPCLTLRENTERPITITEGTNRLTGSDPARVVAALDNELRAGADRRVRVPALWDGHAAERIVETLERAFT
jgi:UDP-N-acetylglucosamine 2-epimerase (non-hydrolysing)